MLEDVEYIKMVLNKVKDSAESFDVDTLDVLSEEMKQYQYEDEIENDMEDLTEQIRNLQMDEVIETVEKILQCL